MILTLALAASLASPAQATLPAGSPPPSPKTKTARSLEEVRAELVRFDSRNASIRDFTANFTQTYRSGALGRAIVESGTVKVKRPSRMLFEYAKPEKKLFVADGDTYYFYVPRDKQVMAQNQRGDKRATARILAAGRLLEHFRCVGEESDPLGPKLILVPLESDPNVTRIAVVLDERLRLLVLEIQDAEGSTSRMVFSAFKENVGLKDAAFRFEVPRGVEVIS